MKKIMSLTITMLFFALISWAQGAADNSTASLYDRLGGAEGISAIVDDVVEAHMVNPTIEKRFLPYKGTPELELAKKHLAEFFIAGSGGPFPYTGRDLKEVHTGMNISHKEFMAALDDTMMVLTKRGIDEETKKDVMAIFWSLKDMVIEL